MRQYINLRVVRSRMLMVGTKRYVTFRCLLKKHKYAIGDASEDSFGEDYEFNTIEEMLQTFLSGNKV